MADLETLLADLTSGDDTRAEAAVPALTVHGQKALQDLIELLQSPILDRRWWAVRALAAFDLPGAEAGLCRALGDADSSVRQCAALGLRERATEGAIEALIETLQDHDPLVRRLAGDALASIRPGAIEALAKAAGHENASVRIAAVRALADMRHPDAIGPLFRAINDPSTMVVHWAEEGLDRLDIGMMFFKP